MHPIAVIAIVILMSHTVFGQQVTVTNERILTGATNLRAVGDKVFLGPAKPDEKLKVESVGLIDLGKLPENPQVAKIVVTNEKRESIETEKLSASQVLIRGSGRVWIDVRVIDLPRAFLLDEQIQFDLAKQSEEEIDNDAELSDVAKGSRDALKAFTKSMSNNFVLLANETAAKRYKTVSEASSAMNALDLQSRNLFKQDMANVMSPKLGVGDLPAHAPQVFLEISKGFAR